jgi:hypothetical protein
MTRSNAPDVQLLADQIRLLLEQLLEQSRGADWLAASRRALALVEASRAVQAEIDFQAMQVWLDKAKAAA